MKAERIQDAPVLIPDWTLNNAITVQRAVDFADFEAACRFAGQFAERLAAEAPESVAVLAPELDIRLGRVAVRLTADPAAALDSEVDLIERAVLVNGIMQQVLPGAASATEVA